MNLLRFLALAAALAATPGLRAAFGLENLNLGDLNKAVDAAQNVGRVAKGVAGIGPEEERVIGGSVAAEIVSAYGGLVRDEAINRRVNLIGRTVAACSDRPELDWRFGVLATDEINAFSAPGGWVFITRGLYALATDDDLLAAILAHEIVHITERHALAIVARGEFLAGAASIARDRSGDFRNLEGQLQQFDLGIGKIIETLCKTGFDPQTEYTADRKGRDLAALAGYSRDGLRRVLEALAAQTPATDQKIFSTHPPVGERIKRLADAAR